KPDRAAVRPKFFASPLTSMAGALLTMACSLPGYGVSRGSRGRDACCAGGQVLVEVARVGEQAFGEKFQGGQGNVRVVVLHHGGEVFRILRRVQREVEHQRTQ